MIAKISTQKHIRKCYSFCAKKSLFPKAVCHAMHTIFVIIFYYYFTAGDCIDLDLGMESKAILDSQIGASSELNGSTPANHGRLKYAAGTAWCASTNDSSPYLQIDLSTLYIICAVSTQGNAKSTDWVKKYTLQTSTDGTNWTDYKDVGKVKVYCWSNACLHTRLIDSSRLEIGAKSKQLFHDKLNILLPIKKYHV